MKSLQDNSDEGYVFIWGNFHSALVQELNIRLQERKGDQLWNQYTRHIIVSHNNTVRTYNGKKDAWDDENVRGKLLLDREYREEFLQNVEMQYKRSWAIFSEMDQLEYAGMSSDQLLDLLHRNMDQWMNQKGLFHILQQEGMHLLMEDVKRIVPETEKMELLLRVPELDLIEEEHVDRQMIVSDDNVSEDVLLAHVKKYPWLAAAHTTKEEVIDTLRNKVRSTKIEKELGEILRAEKEELKEQQKKLFETMTQEDVETLRQVQQMSLARLKIKSCWAGMDHKMMTFRYEVAKRCDENVRDLFLYYMSFDYEDLLQKGEKVSAEEKEERKKCRVSLWKDGESCFVSGDEGRKLAENELGDLYEPPHISEFTGTIARKGTVKGTARLLWSDDIKRATELRKSFQDGEIVVTQMTQPNVVDIVKRSGGIVTDEGGMLSHAAVIAREFGIPCIVGAHVATQMIKDGDIVQINADEGIVKIVEESKK